MLLSDAARRLGASALVLTLSQAGFAQTPPTEPIGAWTLRADPPGPGQGCSLETGRAGDRLLVMLDAGGLRMEASARGWFTTGSLDYRTHLVVDGGRPIDLAARGAGPDGLKIFPFPSGSGETFLDRLAAGTTLTVTLDGSVGSRTATFPVAGYDRASARLRACAAGAETRAAAAAAARSEVCGRLADAVAAAAHGARQTQTDADRIGVAAPSGSILVMCGTAEEPPSVSLSRDGRGIPAAVPAVVDRLAAALAGKPLPAFAGLAGRCLAHVRRSTLRRGGKRTRFPDGATTIVEGEAKAASIRLTCLYYDPERLEPSFTLERA